MKFTAQRLLISSVLDKVSAFLSKGDSSYDTGQYLRLKATKSAIEVSVGRPEVVAVVSIDAAPEGLLGISRPGECVLGGKFAISQIGLGDKQEVVSFSLDASKEAGGTEDGPSTVGTLLMAGGAKDEMRLSCIGIEMPEIAAAAGTTISFPAADLARHGNMLKIAAGNPHMNLDYSLILVRIEKNCAQLVTTDGCVLAVAEIPEETGKKDEYILSYDLFSKTAAILDPDIPVSLSRAKGNKRAIFSQNLRHDGNNVGKLTISLPIADRFIKFEDKIKDLDFHFSCKVRKQDLFNAFSRLNSFIVARTSLVFDKKAKTISIHKVDQNGIADLVLNVEPTGKGDLLDLDVSSRHIYNAVSAVAADEAIQEIDLCFTGKKSLAMISMGPTARQYFAPFRDE